MSVLNERLLDTDLGSCSRSGRSGKTHSFLTILDSQRMQTPASRTANFCLGAILLLAATASPTHGQQATGPSSSLAARLRPYLAAFSGEQQPFELRGRILLSIDGKPQSIELRLARIDRRSFDLELTHPDYAVSIRRRSVGTAFALPRHKVVFVSRGRLDGPEHLSPLGIATRLLSSRTAVAPYAAAMLQANADTVTSLLTNLLGITFDVETAKGTAGNNGSFQFDATGALAFESGKTRVRLSLSSNISKPETFDTWPGMRTVAIDRTELERQLVRGVRRAIEILAPSPLLTQPPRLPRRVAHGELRWIDGQRIVLLDGSPQEIGRAHGELLQNETRACIDSVLYTFGTAETIRSGRWFRHDLEAAYARLSPHIPERHKAETRAMATALQLDPGIVEAINVFPELFHCSGFALFGRATKDGKLYHGRVLDYMTAIGLQDAATTFIVRVKDRIPFANVGYAGFIGSVSGMNARAISLGEMGGRGEGRWDGVPMATLMRRALEECDTLDEVMQLWRSSPRTCEYFYVFADGKTNRAVGVSATPDAIEFVQPGQDHPRLGKGIPDAVVLSAGTRLKTLRKRVLSRHGRFDTALGQWLMSRPVAMQSNLHNVLFVPADGLLYVANASHNQPAAERPYVRLDLRELLRTMKPSSKSSSPSN